MVGRDALRSSSSADPALPVAISAAGPGVAPGPVRQATPGVEPTGVVSSQLTGRTSEVVTTSSVLLHPTMWAGRAGWCRAAPPAPQNPRAAVTSVVGSAGAPDAAPGPARRSSPNSVTTPSAERHSRSGPIVLARPATAGIGAPAGRTTAPASQVDRRGCASPREGVDESTHLRRRCRSDLIGQHGLERFICADRLGNISLSQVDAHDRAVGTLS